MPIVALSEPSQRRRVELLQHRSRILRFLTSLTLVSLSLPLAASVASSTHASLQGKEYRDTRLQILDLYDAATAVAASNPGLVLGSRTSVQSALQALGVTPENAFLDRRSGRWSTLVLSHSLLPGLGAGNSLSWQGMGESAPVGINELRERAWVGYVEYLDANQSYLGIDTSELVGRVDVHQDGAMIAIHGERFIEGVSVRQSSLTTIIKQGNIILFGTRNWGDQRTSATPSISMESAAAVLKTHVAPLRVDENWQKPELVFVPLTTDNGHPQLVSPGQGVEFRLAWALRPGSANDRVGEAELGYYEALIDAHTGSLLSFADTRVYGAATPRNVKGGIYPVSNDGTPPDGTEQAGFPMPSANISFGGDTYVTDTGGNVLACLDGSITSDLTGPYVQIVDNCGAVALSGTGDLDFGTSGGDNCTTPGFGGAGNTHSSRTGFFELNRLIESAQAQLPNNTWIQQPLVSNMNINQNCNAFWGGGAVNFYRSGGGCGNTGEIAAIFDHEWGHGLDDNDTNGSLSAPGEASADIYAALRLDIACIGRGFSQGTACSGYGDACTSGCDGVRDIDWANHASNAPHTIANYVLDGIGTANGGCQGFGSQFGPCGGEVHCEGMVPAEAGFDLFKRDLPLAGYDSNTSLEIGNRISYLALGTVGNWYTCTGSGNDGCNADGGYLNYLAADDDNGNLLDGTPHMQAIFDAFDRHGIACNAPTVQDGGCSGIPTAQPDVTATALDRGVHLSWDAIAGATWYNIYRTDGVFACAFGKTLVGTTTGLEYTDSGLQNGHGYSYVVLSGNGDQGGLCMGPASGCVAVTPVAGPNPSIDAGSASLAFASGDGDEFIDNCENATLTFDYSNIGGALTNPVITSIVSTSHPEIDSSISFTASLGASLGVCEAGQGSFDFQGAGLSFGETVEFRVGISGDELGGVSRFGTLTVGNAESDLQAFGTKTFAFETDNEDWEVQNGTFTRETSGGASGTTDFFSSSSLLDDQCDQIRSPAMVLSATSTLSLHTNYEIEAGPVWYDRANIGVVDESGTRTAISPDGGRLYDTDSSAYGGCNSGEPGWSDGAVGTQTWGESTWSNGAIGSSDEAVQLDVIYSTDGGLALPGFNFDEVTVTNFSMLVPDAQTNSCVDIFSDGFELGNVSGWSFSSP